MNLIKQSESCSLDFLKLELGMHCRLEYTALFVGYVIIVICNMFASFHFRLTEM